MPFRPQTSSFESDVAQPRLGSLESQTVHNLCSGLHTTQLFDGAQQFRSALQPLGPRMLDAPGCLG